MLVDFTLTTSSPVLRALMLVDVHVDYFITVGVADDNSEFAHHQDFHLANSVDQLLASESPHEGDDLVLRNFGELVALASEVFDVVAKSHLLFTSAAGEVPRSAGFGVGSLEVVN